MEIILRNTTQTPYLINEAGITLHPNEDRSLSQSRVERPSVISELEGFIQNDELVLVLSDGTPLSKADSLSYIQTLDKPAYEAGYTKTQVDTLISSQQAYTDQQIADLASTSPDLLDTLGEIADALGNDPNFATTITNELANKSDISHNHFADHYQKSENDVQLAGKSDTGHNHFADHYTKDEANTQLAGKASVSHQHADVYADVGHAHDDRYHEQNQVYTKAEIDALLAALGAPIFGSNRFYACDNTVTTITTTSFYDKIILPFTIVSPGIFRLAWTWMWNLDSTSDDFVAEVGIKNLGNQNETVFVTQVQEPQDSSGSFGSTGTNQRYNFAGFTYKTLTSGSYESFVRFKGPGSNTEASMWNACVEGWRVE